MALVGDELHGRQQVVELGAVEGVVKADPAPAGLDAAVPPGDDAAELPGPLVVDAQQLVPVGPRAGAAGPALDAEQVVEEGGDEPRVEIVVAAPPQVERDDADAPRRVRVAQQLDAGVASPARQRLGGHLQLQRLDDLHTDRRLHLECERRLDGLEDTGGARALPRLDVPHEVVVGRADVVHGAAPRDAGGELGVVAPLVEDQHPAAAGAAEELVGGDEDGVEGGLGVAGRVHVDPDVGCRGGVVEKGERVVSMQQAGDLVDGGAHAGDVGGGGEGADAQSPPVGRLLEQGLEVAQVDAAVGGQPHLDDGRQPLAPGDLVRVVLVGTDEDHRLVRPAVGSKGLGTAAEKAVQQVVEQRPAGRRQLDADQLLHAVDRGGGPVAAAYDAPVRAGVDRRLDQRLGLVQQGRRDPPAGVVLGVAVGVEPLKPLQVVLDEVKPPPRGRVVRVDHAPRAERRLHRGVDADDLAAQEAGVDLLSVHGDSLRSAHERHPSAGAGAFLFEYCPLSPENRKSFYL